MLENTEGTEYRIVKATALRKRAGAAEQERLLNEWAQAGWEFVDARRSDIWDWAWDSTDTLVFRRTGANRAGGLAEER